MWILFKVYRDIENSIAKIDIFLKEILFWLFLCWIRETGV